MLEIILMVVFSKKIAAMVREKGRSPAGYVVMFILFWIAGEFLGAIVGAIVSLIVNPQQEPSLMMIWPLGLLGAALGAGTAYLIASSVSPVHDRYDGYDDDLDDRGRSRPRRAPPSEEPYWDRPETERDRDLDRDHYREE
jgi:hypothetical protein